MAADVGSGRFRAAPVSPCSRNTNRCVTLKRGVVDDALFFRALGRRVREIRKRKGLSQEDMISFGFSARHWQQIEAGRPITLRTLLRICDTFRMPLVRLLRGLDRGLYRGWKE